MASKTAAHKSATRKVESGRYERAITEGMAVEARTEWLYDVTNQDSSAGNPSTYTVDLESPSCDCYDFAERGDRLLCKHIIRAAVVDVYRIGTVRSRTIAQVVRYGNDHGCSGRCNGVFQASDDGLLPCPLCCDAARSPGVDEYDVWALTGGRGQ
jgi:hypothetical protein